MLAALKIAAGNSSLTLRGGRKPKSHFPPGFVATPKDGGLGAFVAPGVSIAAWPAADMQQCLHSRKWGQWLVENDALCRKLVAIFVAVRLWIARLDRRHSAAGR
jgi:hypothetical protein